MNLKNTNAFFFMRLPQRWSTFAICFYGKLEGTY